MNHGPVRKLGNLGNLGNLGSFFPAFFLLTFRYWPNTQNRKIGSRKCGKRIPTFPTFPSFRFTTFRFNFQFRQIEFFHGFFFVCFLFLLCLNLLFQAIVLRLSNMQVYVQSGSNIEQCVLYMFKIKKAHQIDISDSKSCLI